MANNKEDQARIGFESGRSDYQVNYSFIYPSAAENKGEEFQKKIGWARYPRTEKDKPSKPSAGRHQHRRRRLHQEPGPGLRRRRAAWRSPRTRSSPPRRAACRPPPRRLYDDPKVEKALPFADLLRESIEEGAPRPVNPAYSDISLAIQKTFHPPDSVEPDEIVDKLKDRMDKAAEGKIF